ncbi:spore germination protein [Paenibacillus allorhizosphaerae]|uniref:Spore germination protein B1 n=1 Tax=Paenibacillus allorhizosphaerae TaxID=2849866 RepID=A0ABM8VN84_9BACL|nr:spore germination protein [Paenibacillus allorhizosphaerae]CAG7651063.1 Spore germination protein B1 [Paenibacillus allorhizosphaerae]
MVWKKVTNGLAPDNEASPDKVEIPLTMEALIQATANMSDAEIIERPVLDERKITLLYIKSLIDLERLNETVIEPLNHLSDNTVNECIAAAGISEVTGLQNAKRLLMQGSVLVHDSRIDRWWAVSLPNPLGRSIESSETETIILGPKDSFSEKIEDNINLIRRRLPTPNLKAESFTVGSLSKTTIVIMYMEGVTNPKHVATAREKITAIDYDMILEASHLGFFIEDHVHSVFPQFMQTDRPDASAYFLGTGKLVILVGGTPFVLVAPITFFHLFQSPEDYINRWLVASFLRLIRYLSFMISITLIPLYVALTTHHYQMIPLQNLFVLLESRSKLPFTPFWEACLMLITLEIMKEASLRMPTKSGQTLGVIGGIVIGQAAVEAGFASKVLIVLVGISAIASFLVPNYMITKANTMVQFVLLILASFLGLLGMVLGLILLLIHLNGLSSLKQPYLAPLAPFFGKDWKDLFIRAPLPSLKSRPLFLHPLKKWRYSRRR